MSKFKLGDEVKYYNHYDWNYSGKTFTIKQVINDLGNRGEYWYVCKHADGKYLNAPESRLTRKGVWTDGKTHDDHEIVMSYIKAPHIDGFKYCRTCRKELKKYDD